MAAREPVVAEGQDQQLAATDPVAAAPVAAKAIEGMAVEGSKTPADLPASAAVGEAGRTGAGGINVALNHVELSLGDGLESSRAGR